MEITSVTKIKTCSFFGHRKITVTEQLQQKIYTIVLELIQKENVKIFYFGGLGEFDKCCREIVSKLKEYHTEIQLIFCVPDEKQLNPNKKQSIYKHDLYDKIIYLPPKFDYWYTRIYYRNCEMIDQSDFILFYLTHTDNSGAYKCLQYAKKRNKNIIEL